MLRAVRRRTAIWLESNMPAVWGVSITLSMLRSGLFGSGGSFWKASSPAPGDASPLERLDEGRLIDDGTPRGVDHIGSRLHDGKFSLPPEVKGFLRQPEARIHRVKVARLPQPGPADQDFAIRSNHLFLLDGGQGSRGTVQKHQLVSSQIALPDP
ncbi:MAG TPA: hypothetical protein VLM91_28595 [Candidatus Methylomirabilis sp.]|nr:hypothetical protein [Candidatus Methylomirabilis sp.]